MPPVAGRPDWRCVHRGNDSRPRAGRPRVTEQDRCGSVRTTAEGPVNNGAKLNTPHRSKPEQLPGFRWHPRAREVTRHRGREECIEWRDWAEVQRLFQREGLTKTTIARRLGMSRTTVIRLLALREPPRYVRARVGTDGQTNLQDIEHSAPALLILDWLPTVI